MKTKIHSLIIEGIIFCGSGLLLLSYSLTSYNKAFNKEWGQSPYLFPLIVALALIGLSVWLIGEGARAMKKDGAAGEHAADVGQPASGEYAAGKTAAAESASGKLSSGKRTESAGQTESGEHEAEIPASVKFRGVVITLVLCTLYYAALSFLKIPYITVGVLSFQYTFSTFEVVTLVFLGAMMAYMGVRKPLILTLVPVGTTLFLSIAFRTLLHVLLP